ncbi:hypothetical protein FJZ33_04720 [Candidatus Poribacteria bacterium]|nr:hypothetical protein [Candidatus Poribacteria bacterium]
MAGRGTDIVLGNNLHQIVIENYVKRFEKTTGNIQVNIYSQFEFEIFQERYSKMKPELQKRISLVLVSYPSVPITQSPSSIVYDFGLGLYVIGTERHNARRIDDQLKGRSARQGDPGASRFYLSLQDDLFRVFGREEMESLLKAFENSKIQKLKRLTRKAQKKSEETSYQMRKYVLDRDNVADKQRRVIYKMRQDILSEEWDDEKVKFLIEDYVSYIVKCGKYISPEKIPEEWDISGLVNYCMLTFGVYIPEFSDKVSIDEIMDFMVKAFQTYYEKRKKILGEDFSRKLCRAAMINALDMAWIDYLSFQREFDNSLMLRSYVKDNILVDYKRESAQLFNDLLASIRSEGMKGIFTYPLPGERPDLTRWKDGKVSKEVKETLISN